MILRYRWVAGRPIVVRDWRYRLHWWLRFLRRVCRKLLTWKR